MAATLIVVDCEAVGPCPGIGQLVEFGAVVVGTHEAFRGLLYPNIPSPENPAVPEIIGPAYDHERIFREFSDWVLAQARGGRATFVSDNPAYDWQWINHGLHTHVGVNPFGFSARRIGDFAAGLLGDFRRATDWKSLRRTRHTHDPVDDALGNAEALERLMAGELPH